MGKPAPKSPDPVKVSAAQTQSNKDTAGYLASLNRINQSSPFGSINYNQSGVDPSTGAPSYSQQTTLSPELQSLLGSQISSQQGISDAIGGVIGRLPSQAFDPSGINTDAVRDASYNRQVTQLTPQFEEGARNLQGTLSDRGIPIGSEIYNNEQNRYDTAKNTSLSQAARQAELDAGSEQSRQYNQALQNYNLPYQNLSSLLGGSQAVGNPQFSGVPQSSMAPTDVSGNIWNAYTANTNAANQANSNLFSGILGLGKLGLGAAGLF